MAAPDDPLAINLSGQTKSLLSQLGNSPHTRIIQNVCSRAELLRALSILLRTPSLTTLVATLFRPILLDLCARFLDGEDNWTAKFEALCLLIGVHPELYPVLSSLLCHPQLVRGPLSSTETIDDPSNASDLQRILLAYYRLLHANRDLPTSRGWSLTLLSRLMWGRHPDPGVRFLAIQCYALQTGMLEAERTKLEKDIVGDIESTELSIPYGTSLDGTVQVIDGWLLHMTETARLMDARNELLTPQNYYSHDTSDPIEPIHLAELSPLIVNVHGILMLLVAHSRIAYLYGSSNSSDIITLFGEIAASVTLSDITIPRYPQSNCHNPPR
ncbi:hypothetical protein NM688_g2884 [Phlebia brevispora]|uniref:Uncharacterized protein n=1 Tax=Phlebia brevispora TaxID=194682 RepID=A0ACC1T7H8_9APHY|nr:hypothetical protein NM688_g2884 [Phlebia brevispora]